MITVQDVLGTARTLLNDCSEEELSYPIMIEQLGSLITLMKYERILGNKDEVITKGELVFSDTTGIVQNTLTNFDTNAIYLEFNSQPIDECPVGMLDLYADAGVQRAAFWTEGTVRGTKYCQLSLMQTGTLKVWYEPTTSTLLSKTDTIDIQDSLKWCLATRLAFNCIAYVKFIDPIKMSGIPALALSLDKQADKWKQVYIELKNRVGGDRPFSRLPFMAGNVSNN